MDNGSAALGGDTQQLPQMASALKLSLMDGERHKNSSRAGDRHTSTPTPHRHNPYGIENENSSVDRRPSYGSVSRVPTGSGSYSQYSGSSALAGDYWPKVDSDESDEASAGQPTEILPKQKKSTTKRFFKYLARKLGPTAPRYYGQLPNDDREYDRNEIQHRVILDIYDDKYHLAPVANPKRVLDVGTGPGTWAIEYAKLHPQSTVVGFDIEYVRPSMSKPKNCTFMVMDATKDWEFVEGFDLIHVRMLGDLQGKGHLVESVYANLNPGGWAEFAEWIVHIQSPDHSLDGSAFMKWNRVLRQGLRALGTSVFYPLEYRRILNRTGFINVQENKYAAPTNPCYPGKRLQRIGTMMTKNWLGVLEPLTVPVFGALGWSQERIDLLLEEVKKEIVDTKFHSYMTLMTVSCQKPMENSASSSKVSFAIPPPSA